ncbi:MAG TPA: outer membrane lipoprotein carrier protein LolA [Bacillales bacterium]|nr:outer membrane lipoprotein carrier protein LolA [Bacillales bacterium]
MTGILLVGMLSACGGQSQEEVMSALNKKLEQLKSYKAEAMMTLNAGDQPSTYQVEIWHKKPEYYRIHLKNKKQKLSQMILKNEEGVFVLTPQLNKSYRFQSDWPKNGSQWYLYESLLKDILNDPEPEFTRQEDTYVFKTKTNYKHSDLKFQKITLTKKDLKPVSVKIMGEDGKVLVDMEFTSMNFNVEFDNNAFELQKNMSSARLEMPAMAQKGNESLNVYYPTELPKNSHLATTDKLSNGEKVVLEYAGKNSFTLIEQVSQVDEDSQPASVSGKPVNLGFAIGYISGNAISWTYDGTEFFLASKDLTQPEMIDLARSVTGKQMK